MSRPRNNAAPMTVPTTMPAIWPPDRPLISLTPGSAPFKDDDDVGVVELVVEEKSGCTEVKVGRRTLAHREPELDVTQHESVALTELELQYVHMPLRFDWKPQSTPSFV